MDTENSSNTTTDPRAHVTAESVESLPAGLFMDEDGNAEAGTAANDGDSPAVGLDTEEAEAPEEEAAADAGEEEGAAEAEAGEEETADDGLNEAPEFWSAEDKAAWSSVPPALRPLLHKIDKQRVAFEQEKVREAAQARKEAADQVKEATAVTEQAAKWWQANGPQFFKAFGDKWAQVDWVKLAEEDPARCQALRMQAEHEGNMLRQAHEQGQRDIEAANKRAEAKMREDRIAEHAKIAAKMPEFFGTSERATKTYKELAEFLFSKGIPAERINNTYEAPIIELALAAMRFEQGQKKAAAIVPTRDAATGQFTARTAPTKRVQPGPALNRDAGDRNAEAARRAGERFRKGGGASIEDAAAFAKASNLFG
jgi:hypothetical protein